MTRRAMLAVAIATSTGASACNRSDRSSMPTASRVPESTPTVLAVHPHDPRAFTQGLEWHRGQLLESTGRFGESSVRRVDLATAAVLKQVPLAPQMFGEGLTRVDDRVIQLTWRSGLALIYDVNLQSVASQRSFAYEGEGWGLCYDGRRLIMSDGSPTLVFRNPQTFEWQGAVDVTLDGAAVAGLNELECVNDLVYANVWTTSTILVIDPGGGVVVHRVRADRLIPTTETPTNTRLNGIAFVPETGRFLLTGKLWPRLYEVELAPISGGSTAPD
ncbi:MAG: glutaminyl-peptide cyclotransferase [Myxococcales bacterium FL481]|nr:MAG: glutaminyl-peptide cyclotransferase [Myxococcales bacterium FL481]